jgi:hypothetical protein
MDDQCIALLLEHDIWYVPTLAISHLTASQVINDALARYPMTTRVTFLECGGNSA